MKKMFILFSFVLITASAFSQATWVSDKMHSKLGFSITHLGISDVTGLFTDFTAKISTAKDDFSDAVFDLTVNTASINTSVEPRDNHLKSPDFFDVATFPSMTFKSTGIKPAGKDKYTLTGNLTLHGTTKPVTMEVWFRGTVTNPMSKKPVTGFQLTGKIDRTAFGIGAKFPAPMLSNEVYIKADGEFGKE